MLIIKGRVIDGTGAEPVEKGIVAVEGNEIIAVGEESGFVFDAGVDTLDVGDGTIMPGFIEQHTHFGVGAVNLMESYAMDDIQKAMLAVSELETLLNAGFTSAREAGGIATSFVLPLEKGWIRGPRIFPGGKFLTQTGGHADFIQKFPLEFTKQRITHTRIVDGRDECRRAAREQFRAGAKFLKIMTTGGLTSQGDGNRESQFSDEEIAVFVEEAKMHDTYVSAHAQGTNGIKSALRAGVKSIEHGMFMDDECIELMLKNDAWLIPTFTIVNAYLENMDKLPKWIVDKLLASNEAHFQSARRCYEAGVKIGLGSDLTNDPAICPFGINGREFEYLTRMGMSPIEAIKAGTSTGAEIIRMQDKVGSLKRGMLADIVVCSGNPVKNISLLGKPEEIVLVMQDGKIIKNTLRGSRTDDTFKPERNNAKRDIAKHRVLSH